MAQTGLVRRHVLGAAVACVLIGFGLLPSVAFLSDLAPRPAVIVNDTSTRSCWPIAPTPAQRPEVRRWNRATSCGLDRRAGRG
ncbi:MAG TPA: hypothetical protein VNG93_02330 [Candidatus Dormibacteraeota bacterium]|nr:hypothetical protein [Candidatus Dormibacteraeota bacterium]